MGGKEGGGCLLDGDVFLELKSVCNKISDFNIRNLILLVCTGSYLQPVWQEASITLILHISFSFPCMFSSHHTRLQITVFPYQAMSSACLFWGGQAVANIEHQHQM